MQRPMRLRESEVRLPEGQAAPPVPLPARVSGPAGLEGGRFHRLDIPVDWASILELLAGSMVIATAPQAAGSRLGELGDADRHLHLAANDPLAR